jgi:hypothetical protein
MTTPRKWTPTDPITAERLNTSQAEASRSRRDIFLGDGSSMVNEQLGNQSANMRRPQIKLVVALENFGIPETPTDIAGAVDDVPSGLVREVRLGRITAAHQDDTSSVKFLAYDPAAWLSGKLCQANSNSASLSTSESGVPEVATKSECDVFHVVYNVDSKRWEALGGAVGSVKIVYGAVKTCLGEGWYEVDLTDWSEQPPVGSDSSSMSSSVSDDPCDLCPTAEEFELDGCENLQEVEVERSAGSPTGETVYAHTAETIPLKIGGLVKMIKRVATVDSGSQSVSQSVSDDPITDLYDIVDSQKPLISLPFPQYECCEYPNGTKEVKMVQCNRAIVAGIICIGPAHPCDESDSASASESM